MPAAYELIFYLSILKHEKKGGPLYVASAFFLTEISEVKIRATNPKFFANVRRLAFSILKMFIKKACYQRAVMCGTPPLAISRDIL
jgi:hypothetical protein